MKPSSGYIPNQIAVITGNFEKTQVGCFWDSCWTNDDESGISVLPAFIADAASPNAIQTGKNWVMRRSFLNKNKPVPKVEIKDNAPIKNIKICSVEKMYGGIAHYKVIADGAFVSCKEDVILDAMLNEGVEKNGIIKGEYIWAKLGVQMRLVRVGSSLHKKLLILESRKKLKKIKNYNLVPGTIYADKKDNQFLFIGKINSTQLKQIDHMKFSSLKVSNKLLYLVILEHQEKNPDKLIHQDNIKSSFLDFVDYRNSHSWVEEIGKINIDNLLPRLRSCARTVIKSCFQHFSAGKTPEGWIYDKRALSYDICRYSILANMYDHLSDPIDDFDYETLLTFV